MTERHAATLAAAYRGKRVFLTGHTGFKGSWLAEWLLSLGAEVHGFALAPATTPALFGQLQLAARLHHTEGDVRDLPAVEAAVAAADPDFVFHLAAQPLVRLSYREPVETYATNVMGTVHVLDACRRLSRPCQIVAITTDKCYDNREWVHGYRETDPLGGHDPYSSSKGAAEIVIEAYRRSYFSAEDSPVRLGSARAGNVIGGGDWAEDRIVPDCFRALREGSPIRVRNKTATRPWQHVLEPLGGYLLLGAALAGGGDFPLPPAAYATAFNFGPPLSSNRTVADLVVELLSHAPGSWIDGSDSNAVHEASLLNLATDKAHHLLGWGPRWDFAQTIARTSDWYREADTAASPDGVAELTRSQIEAYCATR